MTNIKALAEKILRECEVHVQMDGIESQFVKDLRQLATALLKVLEDGEWLFCALQHVNEIKLEVTDNWANHALESHEKLMEELGGEL